jgi:hypothetical protein
VGLVGAGILGWKEAAAYNWDRVKPQWWLRSETANLDAAIAGRALDELARRVAAGSLSRPGAAKLLRIGLDDQLFASGRLADRWSTLIGECQKAGLVEPAEWEKFLRQRIRVTAIQFPQRIRLGHPLIVETPLEYGPFGSWGSAPNLRIVVSAVDVKVDGLATRAAFARDPAFVETELTQGAANGNGARSPLQAEIRAGIGQHPISVRATVQVFDEATTASGPLFQFEKEAIGVLAVAAEDASPVKLVRDPQLQGQVNSSFRVQNAKAGRLHGRTEFNAFMWGDSRATPVQCVANAYLRLDGGDYWIGQTYVWGPSGHNGSSASAPYDELPAKLPEGVDLVLRPDAGKAEEAGFDEIWGEDIVVQNVQVEWLGDILNYRDLIAAPPTSQKQMPQKQQPPPR